jgi:hypothetical protein
MLPSNGRLGTKGPICGGGCGRESFSSLMARLEHNRTGVGKSFLHASPAPRGKCAKLLSVQAGKQPQSYRLCMDPDIGYLIG